jgi:UPF0716 family protein affecting phage T7 exclusion
LNRYLNKATWPLWLLGLAVASFLLFMNVLDLTPGWLAWALIVLLVIAVGGAGLSSATLIIRVLARTRNWAQSADEAKERIQRWVVLTIAYLVTLPIAYVWFAMIALVGGFLSLGIQQRMAYH